MIPWKEWPTTKPEAGKELLVRDSAREFYTQARPGHKGKSLVPFSMWDVGDYEFAEIPDSQKCEWVYLEEL